MYFYRNVDFLTIINEQTEHTISLATSIKRPSLRELELPNFGLKEVSDLDSLSYNSFEKAFNEFEKTGKPPENKNAAGRPAARLRSNNRGLTDEASFGENLNLMMCLAEPKPRKNDSEQNTRMDSRFLKDRGQVKTNQTLNLSKQSNIVRSHKKSIQLTKSSLGKTQLAGLGEPQNSTPNQPARVEERPTETALARLEPATLKTSFKDKIYRFNQKTTTGKVGTAELRCGLTDIGKCARKPGPLPEKPVRLRTDPQFSSIPRTPELDPKDLLTHKTIDSKSRHTTSDLQLVGEGLKAIALSPEKDNLHGIIYAPRELRQTYLGRPVPGILDRQVKGSAHFSFQEETRKPPALGNLNSSKSKTSETPRDDFASKNESSLKRETPILPNFDKKSKPVYIVPIPRKADAKAPSGHPEKEELHKFRRFSKRLDSQPIISAKPVPLSLPKQGRTQGELKDNTPRDCDRTKRTRYSTSSAYQLIRKTQSLNVFCRSRGTNVFSPPLNRRHRRNDTYGNVFPEEEVETPPHLNEDTKDKILEVLHTKIQALELKIRNSIKKVQDLSDKHKKLSGLLTKLASGHIPGKRSLGAQKEGSCLRLPSMAKKTASELFLPPLRAFDGVEPPSQGGRRARLAS